MNEVKNIEAFEYLTEQQDETFAASYAPLGGNRLQRVAMLAPRNPLDPFRRKLCPNSDYRRNPPQGGLQF